MNNRQINFLPIVDMWKNDDGNFIIFFALKDLIFK